MSPIVHMTQYFNHLTKFLIHGVIDWINKTKESPVKFFFLTFMTCKQFFPFAKMSLQGVTCHAARHPQKRLKEKCLKNEIFLKYWQQNFVLVLYTTTPCVLLHRMNLDHEFGSPNKHFDTKNKHISYS